MKHALHFLLAVLLAAAASGETGALSGLTQSARSIAGVRAAGLTAAPNPAAIRTTTTHGTTVEITVGNLGAEAENVTVRWFWVGRYETSRNFFRAGDGEKALSLDPRKSQVVLADDADIESHETKSRTGNYKSGGKMLGWVAAVYDSKGKLQASKASDTYLQGFATARPPLQRRSKTP